MSKEWHDIDVFRPWHNSNYRALNKDGDLVEFRSPPTILGDRWVSESGEEGLLVYEAKAGQFVCDDWKESLVTIDELESLNQEKSEQDLKR